MNAFDYVLAVGAVLVFMFTIAMDVLLVREYVQRRRNRQKPEGPSDT